MAMTTTKKKGTKIAVEAAPTAVFTDNEYLVIRKFGDHLPPWVIRGIPGPDIIRKFEMTTNQRKQFRVMSADIRKQAKALTQSIQKVATLAAKVEKNAAKAAKKKAAKK